MQKRKTKTEAGTPPDKTGKVAKDKPPPTEAALRSIVLAIVAPEAKAVVVVGEFNNWSLERHPLQQRDRETWHITLQLPPGTYQYKFVIDGTRWEEDAHNPKRALNEFGTTNSILEVV